MIVRISLAFVFACTLVVPATAAELSRVRYKSFGGEQESVAEVSHSDDGSKVVLRLFNSSAAVYYTVNVPHENVLSIKSLSLKEQKLVISERRAIQAKVAERRAQDAERARLDRVRKELNKAKQKTTRRRSGSSKAVDLPVSGIPVKMGTLSNAELLQLLEEARDEPLGQLRSEEEFLKGQQKRLDELQKRGFSRKEVRPLIGDLEDLTTNLGKTQKYLDRRCRDLTTLMADLGQGSLSSRDRKGSSDRLFTQFHTAEKRIARHAQKHRDLAKRIGAMALTTPRARQEPAEVAPRDTTSTGAARSKGNNQRSETAVRDQVAVPTAVEKRSKPVPAGALEAAEEAAAETEDSARDGGQEAVGSATDGEGSLPWGVILTIALVSMLAGVGLMAVLRKTSAAEHLQLL